MDRLAALRKHQQELAATTTDNAAAAPVEPAAPPSCARARPPSAPPAINADHVEEMNVLLFQVNKEISQLDSAVDEAFLPLHAPRRTRPASTAVEESEPETRDALSSSDQEKSLSSNSGLSKSRPPPISLPVTAGTLAEIDNELLSIQFALAQCKALRDRYDAETQQLQLLTRMDAADMGVVDGHSRRRVAASATPPSSAELQMRCNISTHICERLKATMQRLWTVEERYHAARVEAARRQLTIYFMKVNTGNAGDTAPDASTPEGKAVLQQLKRFNGTRVEVDHLEDVLAPERMPVDVDIGSDDMCETEKDAKKKKRKSSFTTSAQKADKRADATTKATKKGAASNHQIADSYVNASGAAAEDEAAMQLVLIDQLAEYIVNTRQDLQDGQGGIFCFTSCEQLYCSIMDNRMAIADVERNMERLHRLFLDLHFCVMEQEDDVAKMLKNTQDAHERAKRGRLEIKRGKRYYNKCGLCCKMM